MSHSELPFSRTELLLGADGLARLLNSRVLVFGVGGVGSWCVEALVRTGVGEITIVDDDVVVPSNLNRQLPATVPTLGSPKVEALAQRLRSINPNARITPLMRRFTADTAPEFDIASYDCVVDAIDSVADKASLMLEVTRLRVPLFSSMGAARRLDPSRVAVARFEKVEGCALARALRQRFKRGGRGPSRRVMCVYSTEPSLPVAPDREKGAPNGSLCPVTATFGMNLAALVIKELTSNGLRAD